MDDDDLDELLDEVEKKFCSKVSAACSDEKRNKHVNKQGEWSASKHEEPKSSVSEDIDALLEELLEDDYSSSPQSKSEPFSKREQAVKKLSFQTAGRKCCPVFIGGSSVPNGVGTATSQRSCDQLRCISCDFRVLMFDDSEWDASCDYLFLREQQRRHPFTIFAAGMDVSLLLEAACGLPLIRSCSVDLERSALPMVEKLNLA
ncbi:hypothetical protein CHARACLAT_008510 [Characodon lateralis]|uniref:Cilia- and flagella-associated protein 418 n=1 Tax=Characodon lateralis TaxID=208331 RepID=A0ABU7DZ33_9TELE|nr:hypothetical protein [Characodon lateralis]